MSGYKNTTAQKKSEPHGPDFLYPANFKEELFFLFYFLLV